MRCRPLPCLALALLLVAPFAINDARAQAMGDFGLQGFGQTAPAPSGFRVEPGRLHSVHIVWGSIANSDVIAYEIYRFNNSDPDKQVTLIAKVPPLKDNTHAYIMGFDDHPPAGGSYSYFMSARSSVGVLGPNTAIRAINFQ